MQFVPVRPGRPVAPLDVVANEPSWHDQEAIELAGQPIGERLAERWDDLRMTWSQTTFFLFSAEGWR